MDELQKLYDVLVREGKYTKSFEEFQTRWGQDQAYKDKVYDVVLRDGLYTKDKNSFFQKYSAGGGLIPKPEDQTVIQPEQEPVDLKKKGLSIGGENLQDGFDFSPTTFEAPAVLTPKKQKEYIAEQKAKPAPVVETPTPDAIPKGFQTYQSPNKEDEQGLGLNILSSLNKGFYQNLIGNPIKGVGTLYEKAVSLLPRQIRSETGKGIISDSLIEFGNYFNKAIDEISPQDKEFKNSLTDQFAQAFGQVASTILTAGVGGAGSVASKGASMLVKPLGVKAAALAATKEAGKQIVSPVGISSALTMGQSEYERAKQAGASDEQAFEAFYKNAITGSVLETIPVMQFMKRFNNATQGGIINYIKTKGVAGLTGGVEEMTTEVLQGLYANKTAQEIYNENQNIFEGLTEAGGVGFGVGFLLNAMGANVRLLRKQGKNDEANALENQIETLQSQAESGPPPIYKINGLKIESPQIVNDMIERMSVSDLSKINIDITNDPVLKNKLQDKIVTSSIMEQVREANPELNEPSLKAITELEKQLTLLEGNKTQTGKDKAAAIRGQIKNIQENQLQEEAVAETVIAEAPKEAEISKPEVAALKDVESTAKALKDINSKDNKALDKVFESISPLGLKLEYNKDLILSKENEFDFGYDLQKYFGIRDNGYRKIGDAVIRIKDHTPNYNNFVEDVENGAKKIINVVYGDYNNTDRRKLKTDIDNFEQKYPNIEIIDVKIETGDNLEDAIDIIKKDVLSEIAKEYQKGSDKKLVKSVENLLKTQTDAIQIETAGQVPVLTEAGVGEEVPGGLTQTESEIVAQEGVQEEVGSGVVEDTKYPYTIYKGDVSKLETDGDGISFFTRDKEAADYYTTSRQEQGVSPETNKTFEGNIVVKNPLIVDANKPSPIELKDSNGKVLGIFGQGDYIQAVKDAGYDAIILNRKFGTPLDGWEIVSFDRKQIVSKQKQTPAQQVISDAGGSLAVIVDPVNIELKNNKIEGKLFNEQEAKDYQELIESKYNTVPKFGPENEDIRTNLFNYNNPLAEKDVNGVNVRIAEVIEGVSGNRRKTYLLYADGKVAGKFYSVSDAKKVVDFIEANLVKSLPTQEVSLETPKFVRDISALITPATVRAFSPLTKRIQKLSLNYNKLVRQYAKKKDPKVLEKIKTAETQILNDAKQDIIDAVAQIDGVSVKFNDIKRGLWDNAFEPSFNMTLSISPQADTKKLSDLLFDFAEKYSQDSFILETDSELQQDVMDGKRSVPLTEEDSNGLINYPQIIYTFDEPITDEQVADLSVALEKEGVSAFNINNNEFQVSVIKTFSKEQEANLNEDEKYEERARDFGSKTIAAAKATSDVLGSDGKGTSSIRIKKSSYQGATNEGTADQTRQYDKSDVLKAFQESTTKVEILAVELADLRQKEIALQAKGKKLSPKDKTRFDELIKIVQPVVQRTFEANKKLYEDAKTEVEGIAQDAITQVDASISPFPIKRAERASVKAIRWYNAFTEKLGDGSRVNIVVDTDANADEVFKIIDEKYPRTDERRIKETTTLGYPKRLIEIITSNGTIAEIQVITNEAYLAKDGIKGFTGNEKQKSTAKQKLDAVRARLGWNIPDGLGHYFYEIQRDTNVDNNLRDEAARLSDLYYDAFTNPQSKLTESFMRDVMSFKEQVDAADKSEWDTGNEGIVPQSLVDYNTPDVVVEEEQFVPLTADDIEFDKRFSRDEASDVVEGERENENGRASIYMAEVETPVFDADGEQIGYLVKMVDDDKNLSFEARDDNGSNLSKNEEGFETLREAEKALLDNHNKSKKKEFDREAKAKAKVEAKKAAKAEAKKPVVTETIDDLLDLDVADQDNLDRIFNALDKVDKNLNKRVYGAANEFIIGFPLFVAQGVVKTLKGLVKGGMLLRDAIKKVASDNKISQESVKDILNIAPIQEEFNSLMDEVDKLIARQKSRGIQDSTITSNVDTFIRKQDEYLNANDAQKKIIEREARAKMGAAPKRAVSIGRVLGALKDITNISRAEKLKIISQIRQLSRDAAKDLVKEIREMESSGKITLNQAANIVAKNSKYKSIE
jgi:hypothetical protein